MSTGLLVVDVQPAFHSDCGFITRRVAQRINNTRKQIAVMWVGDGLTDDDEFSVREYLRAHGARPGRLDQCVFIEKGFGFFRPWMDNGVSREDIVTVGRLLLQASGPSSSEGLDLESILGVQIRHPSKLCAPRSTTARCKALMPLRRAAAAITRAWRR